RSPTSTPSCPDRTWSPRCSSAGSPAPCTTDSATGTCPTTSTSSPSGSTAETPEPAACSSTGYSSKPSIPSPTHSRNSSAVTNELHSSRDAGHKFYCNTKPTRPIENPQAQQLIPAPI